MACLMNYTVQCRDEVSGRVGCFLFDVPRWQKTGLFFAVGPVFPGLAEFYAWDNANGLQGQRRESGFWERGIRGM